MGGLEFCGRNVAAGFVEPPVVEPVDELKSCELDLLGGAPGPARFDQLGLEQALSSFIKTAWSNARRKPEANPPWQSPDAIGPASRTHSARRMRLLHGDRAISRVVQQPCAVSRSAGPVGASPSLPDPERDRRLTGWCRSTRRWAPTRRGRRHAEPAAPEVDSTIMSAGIAVLQRHA